MKNKQEKTPETKPFGIVIFGVNGSGKTTLGRELASRISFAHMDAEAYYFEESEIPFSKPRPKKEVVKRMLADIKEKGSFVLSSVTGDYGEEIASMYQLGIFLSAPLTVRMERVKNRSWEQYGGRILTGGDMYEQEQKFLRFVRTRTLAPVEDWAKTLKCPVVELDGTREISENIHLIISTLGSWGICERKAI